MFHQTMFFYPKLSRTHILLKVLDGGFWSDKKILYFSKASEGMQLCAIFRSTKVKNNTDTALDRVRSTFTEYWVF